MNSMQAIWSFKWNKLPIKQAYIAFGLKSFSIMNTCRSTMCKYEAGQWPYLDHTRTKKLLWIDSDTSRDGFEWILLKYVIYTMLINVYVSRFIRLWFNVHSYELWTFLLVNSILGHLRVQVMCELHLYNSIFVVFV